MNKPAFLEKVQETLQDKLQKPAAVQQFQEKAKEKWEGLQPRERVMLIAMVVILLCLGCYMGITSIQKEAASKQREVEEYRKSLTLIAANQSLYKQNMAEKEVMRQKLIKADAKIGSTLGSMASAIGFDVSVSPKEWHKVSDDSGAEELEIEVTMKNIEYSKFIEYLVQIQKLDTPLYMRHINMVRTSNLSSSEAKMTVSITLMYYRIKEAE